MTSTPRQNDSDDLDAADDLRTFEERMRALFSRLPRLGDAERSSAGDAAHQTNDAKLNLSA